MNIWDYIIDGAQIVTAIAAVIAIFLTRRGWKEAAKTANEQALQESIMAANYDIYKDILKQVNEIVSKNSKYITDLDLHIKSTASILNEWHGLGVFKKKANDERKNELGDLWFKSSIKIINNAYDLRVGALDLTRILDMSGADFGNHSKIYNALRLVYRDLNQDITDIIGKWTKIELERIPIEQYEWLKEDTQAMMDRSNEFIECVDDVLKHSYNKLVATPMHKTPKSIDMNEKRRIITVDGLRDNRINGAS